MTDRIHHANCALRKGEKNCNCTITVLPNLAGLKGAFTGIYDLTEQTFKNAKLAQEYTDAYQLTNAVYVESNMRLYYPAKGREYELKKYPKPEPVTYKPVINHNPPANRNWLESYTPSSDNIPSVTEVPSEQPTIGNGIDDSNKGAVQQKDAGKSEIAG